jgi:hypothetical protein
MLFFVGAWRALAKVSPAANKQKIEKIKIK